MRTKGRTDRHDEAVTFRNVANAPRIEHWNYVIGSEGVNPLKTKRICFI
jgi:aryl carrier-like protein